MGIDMTSYNVYKSCGKWISDCLDPMANELDGVSFYGVFNGFDARDALEAAQVNFCHDIEIVKLGFCFLPQKYAYKLYKFHLGIIKRTSKGKGNYE